ncbi:MAG TPA: cyclic nucleotide-binding domain-containing protein [Candidatus Dormibacteraeota bacterium]|nr:cyclic nucleotide-binding domain-containing protein [Candidatus Dormibacteraeota bacterium]
MGHPGNRLQLRQDAMSPLLARVLHVRRTELKRTLQVAGFAIVVGWAMYTAFSAAQSIFLNRAGPSAYPLFFIILALSVWPMVALQGWVTRRFGVGRAFRMNLVANAVVAVGAYIAYSVREDATVAFAVYVVYSVAFELVMLHFWAFVTQHFNLLEGKRIFPVIAAGSSIGYILAGVTTTVVAVYATEPLIFIWAFGSAVAAFLSIGLERTLFRPAFTDESDEFFAEHEAEKKKHGFAAVMRGAITYVTGSRLVLALVLLALVVQVASRIGDYLVAVLFVAATHNNLQALTILIGNAWLASYVVQLVVSLFITPWILARLGVKNAIAILPIFTLIGFAAVAVNPVLATALFLFIVRNGLQTGLDDPVQNVLGGIVPAQVGPKLKFLLDNAVLPGAAVLSGVVLLVAQRAITASVEVLAVIGFVAGVLFILAALRVRGLYVQAIYERLRTHTLSLADFTQALGRQSLDEVAELQAYIRTGDEKARQFAVAALGKGSPEAFAAMLPELLTSVDPGVRRLALQMAPPDAITLAQLEAAASDPDGWVRAAAAVAGVARRERWDRSEALLSELAESGQRDERAAAVWAAAFTGNRQTVVEAMRDTEPRVRLESLRSFAKLKGDVANVAEPLIECLRDPDVEVRREGLRQAVRWAPPEGQHQAFAEALAAALASGDREVRRLAAEAMAAQSPDALVFTLPLLMQRDETSAATVEALVRSGRPELFQHARVHLEEQLGGGLHLARLSARVAVASRRVGGEEAAGYALLRIGLDDCVRNAADAGVAAMRALHGKRGFATVERGLRSEQPRTRVEALETLLNFGPGWLAAPLVQLLEPESFDSVVTRPLSREELEALLEHPDKWVRETAEAAINGLGEEMKELIALKRVPLFSTLTLEQLASIDRLMVTRHYQKGESIFRKGDVGAELYVVLEGEIRVHLDHDGHEVTLARVGPDKVVGEMSVFDEQPRSAAAVAARDTTVRVLRRDRMQAIVHEHPEVLLEFVKNLSQRLRMMDEQLEASAAIESAATGETAAAME